MPHQPGVLRAVGINDGAVVCVQEVVTAGPAAGVELTLDRERIVADGRDVAHVMVRVVDDAGNFVPTASNVITFEVEGPGRLLGIDNGDPASHEPYQANHRATFNGMCLAIVQSSVSSGQLRVTASSPGLRTESVIVELEAR